MDTVTALRPKSRAGSRHQPERTRLAILDAAGREFSVEGIAGARIDAIARAAGVNKALLYYYFKDKDALYGAVMDRLFAGLRQVLEQQLDRDLPAGQKILACAGAHFDYIACSPLNPRLLMREVMHGGRDRLPILRRIVEQYFRPIYGRLSQVIQQGIDNGEFRRVDPMQFIASMVAVVVFYFGSSPVFHMLTGEDPLAPERVSARRAAVLDFISAALFRQQRPGKGA